MKRILTEYTFRSPLIEQTLTKHCGANWNLNYHGYERETALSHWEWAFQVEG